MTGLLRDIKQGASQIRRETQEERASIKPAFGSKRSRLRPAGQDDLFSPGPQLRISFRDSDSTEE
jgi:hypothetical protein